MLKTFVFTLLVLAQFAVASPTLSEIMANPLNESNEWVEVYSADVINVSEWMIGDDNSNDTIVCTNCIVSGYFLIIGNSASITSINSSAAYFVTDDSKIGNGLSNTADCVRFFSPSSSTSVCWNSTAEESSLASLLNGTWITCENTTPGGPNACSGGTQAAQNSTAQIQQNESQQAQQQAPEQEQAKENAILKARLLSDVYVGTTYEDLFRVVIKDKEDCSDTDTVRSNFNISGEGIFYTSSWEREVGCSGYDGTGFWTPEAPGRYIICGVLTETTSEDDIKSDNSLCWGLNAVENISSSAGQALKPNITAQQPQATSSGKTTVQKEEPVGKETDKPAEKVPQTTVQTVSIRETFLFFVKVLYKIGLLIR